MASSLVTVASDSCDSRTLISNEVNSVVISSQSNRVCTVHRFPSSQTNTGYKQGKSVRACPKSDVSTKARRVKGMRERHGYITRGMSSST